MRRILITGATGGIAQALISLLEDDFLILVGRNRQKLEQLYGDRPQTYLAALDIRDEAAVSELVAEVEASHGPIDILINNAGYGFYDDFDRFTADQVEDMFAVNTFATMHFCRLVGARMRERGQGHIINIVSMSGHVSTAQSSVYSATKFALIGFTDALRLELAPAGVWVTSINPGPAQTSFFDQADPDGSYQKSIQAFLLQPEQVARKIYKVMGKPKREINMPWTLATVSVFYKLFPRLSDYLARTVFNYKSK